MATSMKITRLTAAQIDHLLGRHALRRSVVTRRSLYTASDVLNKQGAVGQVLSKAVRLSQRKCLRIPTLNRCALCQTYCTSSTGDQGQPPADKANEVSDSTTTKVETTAAASSAGDAPEAASVDEVTGKPSVVADETDELKQTEIAVSDTDKPTEVAVELKHTEIATELKHTDVATELKHTEVATELKHTDVATEVKHADLATELKHTDVATELKHTEVATDLKHADVATEVKHADLATEVKHADVIEVTKDSIKPTEVAVDLKHAEVITVDSNTDKLTDIAVELKHEDEIAVSTETDKLNELAEEFKQAEETIVTSEETQPADLADDVPAKPDLAAMLRDRVQSTVAVEDTDEPDILYKKVILEVKSHDRKVLHSYEQYMRQTAKLLELKQLKVSSPKVNIYRQSVLASAHIYKKHQVQYEERTYYRVFEFKHLTGSTADTLLEYVQRNLPEGTAMKVTKHQVMPMPQHLRPPKQNKQLQS